MKIRNALLVILVAVFASGQPSVAGEPVFRFDGQDYFLKSEEAGIREYLTEGETFERWTTLISVRSFSNIDDPRAYALKVVEKAKASGPAANGQVLTNKNSDAVIADFIVFAPEGSGSHFAEWNLMRIRNVGSGIEVLQYARRFYDMDDSTAKTIVAERKKMIPLLVEFSVPE